VSNQQAGNPNDKKTYVPPKIVHTEVLTSRATACQKADSTCTAGGDPIQS
jgi:hypothetical protein